MNIILFYFMPILISLPGLLASGTYPNDVYGLTYDCGKLGENEHCLKICKIHGVEYGYCYGWRCWCDKLSDKNKLFWDVYKEHC
uniref:Lipolysis-activating peptide 1-alpha chain n=1 Tax=Lychas mucronatus TaxID=172552 RepID=LVPAY_LYCMC|nr:RecName: Full=Lipolysis-activating peptide 1-alpha chain; Short=LVP1-alpha; Contains: RecName: Full=Neurotoxin BmKBTx-like; Flags: Precursor [Lychas mucronatus]